GSGCAWAARRLIAWRVADIWMCRESRAARVATTISVHSIVNGIELPAVLGVATTVRPGRGAVERRVPRTGRTAGAGTAEVLAISGCSLIGPGSGQGPQPDGGCGGVGVPLGVLGLVCA